jgi:hypothetical protein
LTNCNCTAVEISEAFSILPTKSVTVTGNERDGEERGANVGDPSIRMVILGADAQALYPARVTAPRCENIAGKMDLSLGVQDGWKV